MSTLRFLCRVLLWLVWAGAAVAQPEFEALAPAKALAVAPQRPDSVRGLSHSQPHELAASVLAREQCQARAGPEEYCEIVRLNDQHITTGAEIRASMPDRPHPLFLWRYQNGPTVVYLAGSIHVLKPSLYPLPEQLEMAFQHSTHLVLEVDVAAIPPAELQQRSQAYARLAPGRTLADVLPPALYRRLGRHLADFGMTPEMLSDAKPALATNQIVVSRLLTLGYLPDSGVESHFLARRGARPVLALETLEDQLELLFGQPLPVQIDLLDETLDVEEDIEPILADMLVAWLAGDDEEFLELFKAQTGDSPTSLAFSRQLLDDRNHEMAAQIEDFLAAPPSGTPRTYFVLVGAAHLVGDLGIVRLLADKGLQGRRLRSDDVIPITKEAMP